MTSGGREVDVGGGADIQIYACTKLQSKLLTRRPGNEASLKVHVFLVLHLRLWQGPVVFDIMLCTAVQLFSVK